MTRFDSEEKAADHRFTCIRRTSLVTREAKDNVRLGDVRSLSGADHIHNIRGCFILSDVDLVLLHLNCFINLVHIRLIYELFVLSLSWSVCLVVTLIFILIFVSIVASFLCVHIDIIRLFC